MAESPPNILWICTDQQRWDTIRALGNPHIRTPNIDRLVSEGVSFTRAYCQSPICTPSRSSFLTGLYPSSVRNCRNGNERWSEAAPLLPKLLKDAGYDCGLAGKLHLAGCQGRVEPRPNDDGYRVFKWSHHSRHEPEWGADHAYAEWLRSRNFDPEMVCEAPEEVPPELHQSSWCADEAIAFIKEKRSGPWLFSFNCFDPHAPFDPPQEYLDRYEPDSLPGPRFQEGDLEAQERLGAIDFQHPARRPDSFDARRIKAAYYAMIELIDHNVGRMLAALEETGQAENTMVVFMSDHGETLGDHGLLLKGCRFYESLVRVPLVVRWPRAGARDRQVDDLVELLDLAPTFMEAAGLPVPERWPGRSLLPALKRDVGPLREKGAVHAEYYKALAPRRLTEESGLAKQDPGATGNRDIEGSMGTMLFDGRYKLCVYHGHPAGELFDLREDPMECRNLWDVRAYADLRCELTRKSFDRLADALDLGSPQVCRY